VSRVIISGFEKSWTDVEIIEYGDAKRERYKREVNKFQMYCTQ
jgi:hypothetical protein